jgi:hypothetical protein
MQIIVKKKLRESCRVSERRFQASYGEAEQISRFSVGAKFRVRGPKSRWHDLPSAKEAFISCSMTNFQEGEHSQRLQLTKRSRVD